MQAQSVTYRSLGKVALLLLVTFGFYYIYWLVVSKNELNKLGARIPSAWLIILPIGNLYFLYKFAQGFVWHILGQKTEVISYFLLISLLPFVGIFIYQSHFNDNYEL